MFMLVHKLESIKLIEACFTIMGDNPRIATVASYSPI